MVTVGGKQTGKREKRIMSYFINATIELNGKKKELRI